MTVLKNAPDDYNKPIPIVVGESTDWVIWMPDKELAPDAGVVIKNTKTGDVQAALRLTTLARFNDGYEYISNLVRADPEEVARKIAADITQWTKPAPKPIRPTGWWGRLRRMFGF